MVQQAHELRAELGDNPHADSIAQAAVCAAAIVAGSPNCRQALDWLRPQLVAWEQAALDHAQALNTRCSVLSTQQSVSTASQSAGRTPHLYDAFLHQHARNNRKRGGVFFTPEAIAGYIVAQVDRLLRKQCGFIEGLADDRVTIIDPACGTGVFLLAVIDFLGSKLNDNQCLKSFLSRLIGIEILPPAALLAKLNIALKLGEVGYDFRDTGSINVVTVDALSPDTHSALGIPQSAFPVLLGNPPFYSLSTNSNPWISRLVRGDDEISGYIRANGQQLGERKTWLHDDYVKFVRLAQWHVERVGQGIVGFITNHGYLDNATFRLMRQELLRVFSHIEIIDLHGNRRARGAGLQAAEMDENVFGLDQGVAVSLLCRPTAARATDPAPEISYGELRGSRQEKLDLLAAQTEQGIESRLSSLALQVCVVEPRSPEWKFVPTSSRPRCEKYAASWSLADAMPVHATAPVTARDHFVVSFTREELIARVGEFCDLRISDDEIRTRYFHRTRSARYQTGDTRGWKLAEARRVIAADESWQTKIIRCLYRPFDWRYVFWHPAMIDWPRTEVTRQLITKDQDLRTKQAQNPRFRIQNLCLVARRQQLPRQPCTFFWVSDCLALDGVIRSDNRGSESLFPLYVDERANFATGFAEQFAAAARLAWQPLGRGDLATSFGPEDLLAFIYALFYSPNYRETYADELRNEFPRVLLPANTEKFIRMARIGHELFDLHLLATKNPALGTKYSVPSTQSAAHTNTDQSTETLKWLSAVTAFRAGGYIALKKWLQPGHRSADDPDYHRIAAAIARTIEIMSEIDG